MSVLIKNGRVVTAVDDYHADIFISGETIDLIGANLSIAADHTIDARGKLVIPGGIDPHTHLELPFGGTITSDTFETGRAPRHLEVPLALSILPSRPKELPFLMRLRHGTPRRWGRLLSTIPSI